MQIDRLTASLVTIAAAALPAQTLVVDANGGGNYRTIQAAVAVAPSGAKILIRPAIYQESVRIDRKALTILGDSGVLVRAANAAVPIFQITNHPANGRTILARIKLGVGNIFIPYGPYGVHVVGGSGEVQLDTVVANRRFRIDSFKGRLFAFRCSARSMDEGRRPANPAVQVVATRVAVFSECEFVGGRGHATTTPGAGAAAIQIIDSAVELAEPRIVGGVGGHWGHFANVALAADGGPGVIAVRSRVRASGSLGSWIRGGMALFPRLAPKPTGGTGVELIGSTIEHSGVSIAGGAGPTPGAKMRADANSKISEPTAPTVVLTRDSQFRVGGKTTLTWHGPPNASAAAVLSLGSSYITALPFGPIYIDPSRFLFTVATTLDSAGAAQHALQFGADAKTEGVAIYVQPVTVDRQLRLTTGAPSGGVIVR